MTEMKFILVPVLVTIMCTMIHIQFTAVSCFVSHDLNKKEE